MTEPADKDQSLVPDSEFEQPLTRVSYQPGMLLGLEATRAEQDYHRRRLTRHAYWLHGSGTVCGLRVEVQGIKRPEDESTLVRLFVTGGIAIDGLGREVSVSEPYCIDLSAWLASQQQDPKRWGAMIRDGYEAADNSLWLKVTLRYQDCPSGLQPVLATGVNAGTDPVSPSRFKDSVLFELVAERPADPAFDRPFEAHRGLPALDSIAAEKLGPMEKKHLDDATGNVREQIALSARLLYAVSPDSHALEARDQGVDAAATLARLLIARVRIGLADGPTLIVHPDRIEVDNLARTFLFNAELLAQLARQP